MEQPSDEPGRSCESTPHESGLAKSGAEPGRGFSRRVFIRNGSLGAAAVAFVGSIPGLSGLVTGLAADSQQLPAAASDADAAAAGGLANEVGDPVIAHITDAASGDVSIYVGEREIVTRDPTLVAHLLRIAR